MTRSELYEYINKYLLTENIVNANGYKVIKDALNI